MLGLHKHQPVGFSFHWTCHRISPSTLFSNVNRRCLAEPSPGAEQTYHSVGLLPVVVAIRAEGTELGHKKGTVLDYLVSSGHLTCPLTPHLEFRDFREAYTIWTLEPWWVGTPSPLGRAAELTFWKQFFAAKKCVVYQSLWNVKCLGLSPFSFPVCLQLAEWKQTRGFRTKNSWRKVTQISPRWKSGTQKPN